MNSIAQIEKRSNNAAETSTYLKEDLPTLTRGKLKLTMPLVSVALVGTIGNSVPAGYNMGVINMPQAILKEFCNSSLVDRGMELSKSELNIFWSVVVSLFLVGAMMGSLSAGTLANKLGRKNTLILNSLAGIVSCLLFAYSDAAKSVELILAGRLLVGFFGGLGSSVAPLYLMETTPIQMRGAFGVMQQLGLTLGILISQILGQKDILGTEENWPTLLSLYGVGIGLGLILLIFSPKSPSYLLIIRNNEVQAYKELERLRGRPISELQEDVIALKREQKLTESEPDCSLLRLLTSQQLRMPLLLICLMHAGQQFSGISAIFYYSETTFEKAGMTKMQSQYGSIGAGLMNVLMACLAVPLVNWNRRRSLIMISNIGVIICLIWLCIALTLQNLFPSASYVVIAALLCYVCIYGVGLGPLPYMIGSELFQQAPRAAAMGLGCTCNWMANCLVALTFPYLQEHLHQYLFLIYMCITVAVTIFIYVYLPETKGVDPVEVALSFASRKLTAGNVIAQAEKEEFITSV